MTTKKKNTKKPAAKKTSRPFVIARCKMAGVHAGYLGAERGGRLTLHDSRRIWYWDGAASLSEIAVYGCNPAKSKNCKFAAKVATLPLLSSDVFELIHCQPAGQLMIESQPEWRAS